MTFRKTISRPLFKVVLFGLLVLAAAALLWGLGKSEARPQPTARVAAPAVTVAEVVDRPLHQWEQFSGRLQAVNTVRVQPRVSGYVDRVAFTDGARVKKGQLLVRIDPRPFQAEVDRLTAERSRAASQLTLAKANFARAKRLIKGNAISRQQYDKLAAAEASAKGELGSVEGSLEAARLNLEFTRVRSPINGRISRALITAGNLVNSNSLLATVVSQDPIYAYFDVDEQTYLRYSKLIQNGDGEGVSAVFMGLVDEDGYPHRGRLNFVDNQVDPDTGTIRARAQFDNPNGRYTPGLFVHMRLVGGPATDTVLIDDRAVGTDLDKRFVLVLKSDNRIAYRQVELGSKIGDLRVVRKGLKPGEVIVVDGLQHVTPGQTVKPTKVAMTQDHGALRELSQVAAAPAEAKVALEEGFASTAAKRAGSVIADKRESQ